MTLDRIITQACDEDSQDLSNAQVDDIPFKNLPLLCLKCHSYIVTSDDIEIGQES